MPRYPVEHLTTRSIDRHVAVIQRQLNRSLQDGETRQLAVAIVSGSYDYRTDPRTHKRTPVIQAWGKYFRAPDARGPCKSRDDMCEAERIWDFVVLNFRYVYDPAEIDTFATSKLSLEAGGGDCDDAVILFGSLLKSIGFHVVARVIATNDAPKDWVHIYPLVGIPKDNPTKWIPLDCTVNGAEPGWEYEDIAQHRDYQL